MKTACVNVIGGVCISKVWLHEKYQNKTNLEVEMVCYRGRSSSANQGVAIFWQLIKMSRLSGEVYTELCRVVHRVFSAIRINGVSTFQGKVHTGGMGPIVGTLRSVKNNRDNRGIHFLQGEVPLYSQIF